MAISNLSIYEYNIMYKELCMGGSKKSVLYRPYKLYCSILSSDRIVKCSITNIGIFMEHIWHLST